MSDHDFLTPRERAALARNPEASLASQPKSDEDIVSKEAKGVGGFLGFLVAVLIIVSPGWGAFSTFFEQQETASLYPEIVGTTEWHEASLLMWSMWFVGSCISIIAGLLLWKRHKWSTKWIVIILIWLSSVGVTILGILIGQSIFQMTLSGSEVAQSLGRPVIFAAIWTLYLLLSKRVRLTYQ